MNIDKLLTDLRRLTNSTRAHHAETGVAGMAEALATMFALLDQELSNGHPLPGEWQTATTWILCDERMPQIGAPLFFLKLDSRVESGHWDGAEWTALDGAHWAPRKVSHWAPRLVPPPLPQQVAEC